MGCCIFMSGKISVVETLVNAFQLYRSIFYVCFVLTAPLSIIVEGFKIYMQSFGFIQALEIYFNTGKIDQLSFLPHQSIIALLSIIIFLLTLLVQGLLICIGITKIETLPKEILLKKHIGSAFLMLKKRFWSFSGAFVLSFILSMIGSLMSFVGVWIVLSVKLIFFPVVMTCNLDPFLSFRKNIRLVMTNIPYILQISSVIMLLLVLKSLIYLIFAPLTDINQFFFGIEHVIVIFVESLYLPFIVTISLEVFCILNKE